MASRRKLETIGAGLVVIPLSFQSSAAEDGSFPGAGLDDGYISDAYGTTSGGVYGVIRQGVGLYQVILDREYRELVSISGSVASPDTKDLDVQFLFPTMETHECTDGKNRSFIRLRIVSAGSDTDLEYEDRVNVIAYLSYSNVVV